MRRRKLFQYVALALAAADMATAQVFDSPIRCNIRPLQIVEVAAPIGGIVSEVLVRPGATVAAGDLIARFDDDLAKAALASAELRATLTAGRDAAEAQLSALSDRVERLEQGVARRAVSQADLDLARVELALAEGALNREIEQLRIAQMMVEEARIALSKTEVRSPVSGQVGEELIDVGESAQGRSVAVIYVNDPLRVEAYVPTLLLASFLDQDDFRIIVNGQTNTPVPVTLDYVSQVADLSSNTQSVYFTLEAGNYLPGYQCRFAAITD